MMRLTLTLHIIMERYRKKCICFPIILLLFLFLESCLCRKDITKGLPAENNQEYKDRDADLLNHNRNGKQFALPIAVWPYSLGIEFPTSSGTNQLPWFWPVQYQTPAYPIITTETRDGKFSEGQEEQFFSSHASGEAGAVITSPIQCTNRDNEVGICQPFTKCFPMMEIQYGSENYIDYMDVPLAEQMILIANASVCTQSETVEEQLKVCCQHANMKYANGLLHKAREDDGMNVYFDDYPVRLPVITQRPPHRNVLSRQLIREHKCGKSTLGRNRNRPQEKITGGQEAKPKEFPWMVAVFGRNGKIMCGASLITDQFLLSAAHCFSTFTPDDVSHLYVHIGDFNIQSTSDGPHEVRKIEKIIIHKGFKIDNYHNDISLLKLDRPVTFTDRISPICLPEATMDSLERRQIIVTGWGRKYRYGSTTDILRKVEMPIWNLQECKNLYSRFAPGRVLDSNICAGDGKRNKDACLGDSGGPAVMFDGEKYVIVGITSWGKGCGSFPGVYTRTSKFLMWITKHLNQLA